MTCPKCGAECAENVTECPACGVIFARFEAARAQRAAAEAEAAAEAARRANIEALANEGAEPEPAPQEQPPPAPKKSRAWIYGFSLAGLFGLVIGLYGGGSEQTPAPTATEREPERRRPQPVAREGQWFDLTGNVIGCLTPVQLQRALDIYKSGDAVAAERQMREYFDDEICVMLDTPMRVHVEAVQGPYARVRKQGDTGTAWIVMPKR